MTPRERLAKGTDGFKQELEGLLNKHSIDDLCRTPDFMLAEYLHKVVLELAYLQQRRLAWFTTGDAPPPMGANK